MHIFLYGVTYISPSTRSSFDLDMMQPLHINLVVWYWLIIQHSTKMVSGRPLLYLSLPGVAFILGVFWYRRRNKNHFPIDDNQDTSIKAERDEASLCNADASESIQKNSTLSHFTSKSMSINGGLVSSDDESPASKLFGKSAPIQIIQNSRGSPIKPTQQQVDSEVLKNKIQDVEHKTLRSIDEDFENLSSPVDLPDSVNHRVAFYSHQVNMRKDPPVVIRATRTPKISPENSFFEAKYTKEEVISNNNNNKSNNNNNNISKSNIGDINKNKNVCSVSNINNNNNNNLKTKNEQLSVSKNGKENVETQSKKSKPVRKQRNAQARKTVNTNLKTPVKHVATEENVTDSSGCGKRNVDAASPSLSACSTQSGDSGKGSSLPRSEGSRAKTLYEFYFPDSLLGQLYGKNRSYLNFIKTKTKANIFVRGRLYSGKVRICVLEGTEKEVQAALMMIRHRLPIKRYPNFTMQRIHYAVPQTIVPFSLETFPNMQLHVIEGINNDVSVSSVVSGGHIFLQHPLHPSHMQLIKLQKRMNEAYCNFEAPLLPSMAVSAICVLKYQETWCRVQIATIDPEDDQLCTVKFLDYGGYLRAQFHDLRQITHDFMVLPFQATECFMSNIAPIGSNWSPEACDILLRLTRGIVLQAQVTGFGIHDIPEVRLYAYIAPKKIIDINSELVARNLAKWIIPPN